MFDTIRAEVDCSLVFDERRRGWLFTVRGMPLVLPNNGQSIVVFGNDIAHVVVSNAHARGIISLEELRAFERMLSLVDCARPWSQAFALKIFPHTDWEQSVRVCIYHAGRVMVEWVVDAFLWAQDGYRSRLLGRWARDLGLSLDTVCMLYGYRNIK